MKRLSVCVLLMVFGSINLILVGNSLASITVTADAVSNCATFQDPSYEVNLFKSLVVEPGSHTISLTDSNVDIDYDGTICPTRCVNIRVGNCTNTDDYYIFSLNGIGDSKTIVLDNTETIYVGFVDVNRRDNIGSSSVSIGNQSITIDANSNCAIFTSGSFEWNNYEAVNLAKGDYKFTLIDSDVDLNGGNCPARWVAVAIPCPYAGDFQRFTLNGIGDFKIISLNGNVKCYIGFYDSDPNDNSGSSTVLIEPTNPTTCTPPDANGDGDSADDLQAVLDRGADLVLCENQVYNLSTNQCVDEYDAVALCYRRDGQQIYTENFPNAETGDSTAATLRINVTDNDDNVTTIVKSEYSKTQLKSVIFDGNRGNLKFKDGIKALVKMGHDTSGQIIEHNLFKNTRTRSTLYVHEGHKTCNNVTVAYNRIEDAGCDKEGNGCAPGDDLSADTWADGITFACQDSEVHDNIIINATDGAIVLFTPRGSKVYNNTIKAVDRNLLGGINMVDGGPFTTNIGNTEYADYSNVQVYENTIEASGKQIDVGIAQGNHVWFCPPQSSNLLHGASITNNTFLGAHMLWGAAIDGVHEWKFYDNIFNAQFSGCRKYGCNRETVIPVPAACRTNDADNTGNNFFQSDCINVNSGESLHNVLIHDSTAPEIIPAIDQSPRSGTIGTTFEQSGTCFTPSSIATLHVRKPDGSEYEPISQDIKSDGTFNTPYTVQAGKAAGTYTWWAIDGITEIKSNEVSYEIITSTPTTEPPTTTPGPGCGAETVYGERSEETELLRYFRNEMLSKTPEGQELIKIYYQWSPVIVKLMNEDEEFEEWVKEVMDDALSLIRDNI